MAGENRCPRCGAPLTEGAPEGLCPGCLMKGVVLGSPDAPGLDGTVVSVEGPGMQVGHYELLELIGEGGMGLVYRAEQKAPIKRQVALKIVKLGMDTLQVVARFRAEEQALAALNHPNIAQVFDAGTTDSGRPYFAMEYVKGVCITRFCDERKLSLSERLELFRQVCEGVHHAHQKGIIHRDIKPSNILVSVHGDRAVPKIIDFGIAKAITQPLTDETVFTCQGQLLGTPEYMSPEQVDLATQDIDTRSDIYSLGVLLYELLAGVLPFDRESFKHAGFAEVQRTIQEQEPTPPSTRLTNLGEKAQAIAERRQTQLITLARCLHRELEWIPMKAIRKDRMRRYRSASELADDIQNYLTGAPLIAGPESSIYRVRKFMRKHTGSVTMVALVAIVIILGLVMSIIMGCRAEQARQQEASARKQVEQALARAERAEALAQEQRSLAETRAEDYRCLLYFNNIALADVAYHDHRIGRVRQLLDLCPEDLRGWEWGYLDHVTDQSRMTIHGQMGNRLAISPDGRRIAAGGAYHTVKVWDAATGAELMTLHGHAGRATNAAFSADGKRLVSGSHDNTIKVWDVEKAEELMTLAGHEAACGACFSPDDAQIISHSRDGNLRIWDAQNGKELRSWRAHAEGAGRCHAISPDGRCIATGGSDCLIRLWDATTGAELKVLRGHQGTVSSVKFSPDGEHIASASMDDMVKLWDVATAEELVTLSGHKDTVWGVAFDSGGSRIASASRDSTVRVWDTQSGRQLTTLLGHAESVYCVAFSPDGERIFSSSRDRTIKIWDSLKEAQYFSVDDATVVSFSHDWQHIASGDDEGRITVWDVSTGTELMTLHGPKGDMISDVRFSPDGKRLFSSQIRKGTIWDATTGIELMSFPGNAGYVYATFSRDGKYVASWVAEYWDEGQDDNTIKLRDARTGKEIKMLEGHGGELSGVVFSPDSKRLASCDSAEMVKVWDLDMGKDILALKHDGGTSSIAFSQDGTLLASGGTHADSTIRLWDTETGKAIRVLKGHCRAIGTLIFSSDGKRLMSGGGDGTTKIWDVPSGAEVMSLTGGELVAVSPDGKTIAIADADGVTLLESETPADNYQSRRIGASAREVVDKLFAEHGVYSKVIDKLKTDETIEVSVRKVALQVAKARLWQDADAALVEE